MDMVYAEVVVGVFATFFVIGIVGGVLLVCALAGVRAGRWPGRRG